MLIEDTFRVALPIEDAWKFLLDVERIAPCMPGAELQEIEGNEYRGIVKVKVGPITAQYKGTAVIETADESARRIVLKASGRDTRGQGNASATVTANLVAHGGAETEVGITTDLTVTGKVAQFGRGVMQEVSNKLLGQFVDCLERDIVGKPDAGGAAAAAETAPVPQADTPDSTVTGSPTSTAGTGSTDAGPSGASAVRKIDSKPAEPVDLMAVSGPSLLKRLAPVLAAVLALLLVRRRRRR